VELTFVVVDVRVIDMDQHYDEFVDDITVAEVHVDNIADDALMAAVVDSHMTNLGYMCPCYNFHIDRNALNFATCTDFVLMAVADIAVVVVVVDDGNKTIDNRSSVDKLKLIA
jgi:hypothetical protein